jgi:hypothetical protein
MTVCNATASTTGDRLAVQQKKPDGDDQVAGT